MSSRPKQLNPAGDAARGRLVAVLAAGLRRDQTTGESAELSELREDLDYLSRDIVSRSKEEYATQLLKEIKQVHKQAVNRLLRWGVTLEDVPMQGQTTAAIKALYQTGSVGLREGHCSSD